MKIAVMREDDLRVKRIKKIMRTIDLLTGCEEAEISNISALRVLRKEIRGLLDSFRFVRYDNDEGKSVFDWYQRLLANEITEPLEA